MCALRNIFLTKSFYFTWKRTKRFLLRNKFSSFFFPLVRRLFHILFWTLLFIRIWADAHLWFCRCIHTERTKTFGWPQQTWLFFLSLGAMCVQLLFCFSKKKIHNNKTGYLNVFFHEERGKRRMHILCVFFFFHFFRICFPPNVDCFHFHPNTKRCKTIASIQKYPRRWWKLNLFLYRIV